MKLRRIWIKQFRQFQKPLELRDLEDGINLFTGPNEAGKSTIVSAIRAAFFERHRSGSVDDLRPWGDSSASPTVEIEFIAGSKSHKLTKSFLSRKRCELQAGTQRLEGAAAEEYLSDLLGFQYAGKGISASQHWGIPGLLWIQQGYAQEIKNSVSNATDHLQAALSESLGEVASSVGDEVMATVAAERNKLLTPAGGLPRGDYAQALTDLQELEEELKRIDTAVSSYRQKVDALASLRYEHALDELKQPWKAFRAQEQDAQAKLNAIEKVQESLAKNRERASQLEMQVKLLRDRISGFEQDEQTAVGRKKAVESAINALSQASNLAEQWRLKEDEASASYETARETLRLVRQEETRNNLTRRFVDLKQKAEHAATQLAKAQEGQVSLIELQKQAAASEIKANDLDLLRKQHRQLQELRIKREASATRLRFILPNERSIQVGEELVSGTGELLLLKPTTLQLAELGRLEILPGGADLAELGRQEDIVADAHTALLKSLGLASVQAAEIRHHTHNQLSSEIRVASAAVKSFAPIGIEALKLEVASQKARAQEVELALKQLPDIPENADKLPLLSQAEMAEETTRLSLNSIGTDLRQAQTSASHAQAKLEAAKHELQAAEVLISAPDRSAKIIEANQALVDALAEQMTLKTNIEVGDRKVAEAFPDVLRQDVERFQKSADQHEKRFRERRDNLIRLEVDLHATGAQGLEEQRAELLKTLMQVKRRVNELCKRATALDYLLGLLREQRNALTRKLRAPLQNHVIRYLQLLFPRVYIEIDENLVPGSLTRAKGNGTELAHARI